MHKSVSAHNRKGSAGAAEFRAGLVRKMELGLGKYEKTLETWSER